MDLDKIVNITNTLLGINFGISGYLTFRSFILYYQKRNTYRLLIDHLSPHCPFRTFLRVHYFLSSDQGV